MRSAWCAAGVTVGVSLAGGLASEMAQSSGKKLRSVVRGIVVEVELHGGGEGALLVGAEFTGLRAGHGDDAEEVRVVGLEGVGAAAADCLPAAAGPAEVGCGPHALHGGLEGEGDLRGTDGVHLEEDDGGSNSPARCHGG